MKNRVNLNVIIAGILLLAFNISFPKPAFSEENEVLQLREKVAELESRIRQFESLLKESGNRSDGTQYGWQNKKNWRKLDVGMNEEEVKKILGEPIKIIKGVKTLWYYPNFYCGNMTFDDNGRLTGWNEP